MFAVYEVEDVVRIPPSMFGEGLVKVAEINLKDKYENTYDGEMGYIFLVKNVEINPVGKILPGDGASYHRAKFQVYAFKPIVNEIVEGEVIEITDFGVFVRIGPLDALLHISQIMDDYITYDERHSVLMGKKTGKKLEVGDDVRFRIVAVSLTHGATGKVGVTTRQPYLGKLEWIKESLEKAAPKAEKEKAKAVAGEE